MKSGFCERKFSSMFLSGTFTKAVMYIMLLCDSMIAGYLLFGINGMWAGFVIAPAVTLTLAMLFVRLRFGKENFPFLLKDIDSEIEVMDDTLTDKAASELSQKIGQSLISHDYSKQESMRASLFVEEIGLTVLERNKKAKKPVLIEFSLFYGEDSVLIIERDSGELFDITDPDTEIKGLSGFVLGGLMQAHQEKTYLVTTGYNRNMMRFARKESNGAIK